MSTGRHALPASVGSSGTGVPPLPAGTSMRQEATRLVRLAGPLVANNLFGIGIVVSDALMAGRVGPTDLAGVAVGNSLWVPVFLFSLGHLMAIGPTVAHHYGARQDAEIAHALTQGLWLALAISIVAEIALIGRSSVMALMGVEPAAARVADGYLGALAFGVPGLMGYQAIRQTVEGTGNTFVIMVIGACALPVNVLTSYAFIFGKLGLPAYGAVGCGIGSAITMWLMLIAAVWYTRRAARFAPFALFRRFEGPKLATLRGLAGVGAPMGISMAMQTGMFSSVALIIATLGTTEIAAHQIALNFSSLVFMMPLGIGMAATIRVGHARGARDPALARRIARLTIGLGVTCATVGAAVTFFARHGIAALYTGDADVVSMAAALLVVATVLQVGDGLQIAINGCLRGHKDTRVPMLILIATYWGIGFSSAWWLAFPVGLGPVGAWLGLMLCLWSSGVFLWLRLRHVEGRLARTALDEGA